MIFPILKKIGYFLGILLGVFMVVGGAFLCLELICSENGTILSGAGCCGIFMIPLGVYVAYDYFCEFKDFNLRKHVECSGEVLRDEIIEILKSVGFFSLIGLLLFSLVSFIATLIWLPDFLQQYIEYGPSKGLYKVYVHLAGPTGSFVMLLFGGLFVVFCFLEHFFCYNVFYLEKNLKR